MRILHNLIIGASGVMLDALGGDPVAPVTITVPADDAIASDFGRVSADLRKVIDKAENAEQLELVFS
jgi:hypothetical protein